MFFSSKYTSILFIMKIVLGINKNGNKFDKNNDLKHKFLIKVYLINKKYNKGYLFGMH